MSYRDGSVGRLLPGIEYKLEPVPGVEEGGRLHVRGPNIMSGYIKIDAPGSIQPTASRYGEGWHDTGDIVVIDEEGFVFIKGRAKRFAKIGGEMVSLQMAEDIACRAWPESLHAVVSVSDPRKGEQLVLLTDADSATVGELRKHANGLSEINLPKTIINHPVPILGTGKINYPLAEQQVKELLNQ